MKTAERSDDPRFLIDGALQTPESDQMFSTEDPARGEVLGDIPNADERDIENAVRAAHRAFIDGWRASDPSERASVILAIADVYRDHADELARVEVSDNGSPYAKMRGDIDMAIGKLEYFAGLVTEFTGETRDTRGNTLNFERREPLGPVAELVPFNHPLMFIASRVGPALAAGNTVVIKPSEYTSLSALELARHLAADDRVPPGVVNIITGDGEAGRRLTTHKDIAMISLTGSVSTGKKVMAAAAERIVPVRLELGGKNPAIVFPDIDLETAVNGCVGGMNLNWQGQSCGSGSRVLVHESIHDELVRGLVEEFERRQVGLPTDEDADIGAIVSREHYERILDYIDVGKSSEATLRTGGSPAEVPGADGYFIQPTIFDEVAPDSRIAQEEIFGPVLSIIEWSTYEEAIEIANDVEFGLTASIWTNELRTALETAKRVEAGYVWINQHGPHYRGTPFGGVKQSGLGRTHCLAEIEEQTRLKNVNISLANTDWQWEPSPEFTR